MVKWSPDVSVATAPDVSAVTAPDVSTDQAPKDFNLCLSAEELTMSESVSQEGEAEGDKFSCTKCENMFTRMKAFMKHKKYCHLWGDDDKQQNVEQEVEPMLNKEVSPVNAGETKVFLCYHRTLI